MLKVVVPDIASYDAIYKRLMQAAGRPDMANDPKYANNTGRVAHEAEVDGAIAAWTATLPAPEVIRRTLDGRLKISPDGTYRSSDRYLLVGRAQAARPDPVQAAWLYAQMVRWGHALMSPDLLAQAKAVFRPDLYDSILGDSSSMPAGEPLDGIGAFAGPPFNADDIAAHLGFWKIRRQ